MMVEGNISDDRVFFCMVTVLVPSRKGLTSVTSPIGNKTAPGERSPATEEEGRGTVIFSDGAG